MTSINLVLGDQPPFDIWSQCFEDIHKPPLKEAIFDDEDEQTFENFVSMGSQDPNEEGTGRWKITNSRNRIAVYYFGKDYNSFEKRSKRKRSGNDSWYLDKSTLFSFRDYLRAFFQLEVDVYEQFDAIDIDDRCFTLSNLQYDISVFEEKSKRKKKKNDSYQKVNESVRDEYGRRVDVFSLFDILVHSAKPPYLAVLGLFDCALGETMDCGTTQYTDVLGRACGDRVACVSLAFCTSLSSLITTSCHELLHTIGFDHCNSFQCIMNAVGAEDWFFLSPVNLRKMKVFHSIADHDNGEFLLRRYEAMLIGLKSFGHSALVSECRWLERKILLLKNLQKTSNVR